jgi:hypothetical protein
MRVRFSIAVFVCAVLVSNGCHRRHQAKIFKDPFYTQSNDSWDATRIPLIKPYQLLQLNGKKEWEMNFFYYPGAISNVKEIDIKDSCILIHRGKTFTRDTSIEEAAEAWFIVSPQDSVERGFRDQRLFWKFLRDHHTASPEWHDIDSVFTAFVRTQRIDWK